jgi:ribosome-binding ATPase YchF (GTP1/OBG family)
LSRNKNQSATTAARSTGAPNDNQNTKEWAKTHDRSISSLQAEVQSQEITVNRLSSSLELALDKIAKLISELTNPPTFQFDKNLDDKISELSSLIDEKLKPLVLQQEFTTELNYVNGMTANMNNNIFHCTSTGQRLPNLSKYAVDVPTYKLVRDIFNATGPTEDQGHSGGRNEGATQSAKPV